jgi:hypothetical protein
MPRKSRYHPDDTERECTKCGAVLPLTAEHFGQVKKDPQGWTTACKPCRNANAQKRREEAEEKMTPQEYSDHLDRKRQYRQKSAEKAKQADPEVIKKRKYRKYLRETVPGQIKKARHWAIVERWHKIDDMKAAQAGVERDKYVWNHPACRERRSNWEDIRSQRYGKCAAWDEFYIGMMAALKEQYGTEDAELLKSKRFYIEKMRGMHNSETYKLLQWIDKDISLWRHNGHHCQDNLRMWRREHSELPKKDYEFALNYKPKKSTKKDLWFLSPQERREMDERQKASRAYWDSPEGKLEQKRLGIAMLLYEIANEHSGSENPHASRIQRKWDAAHNAAAAEWAEEQLAVIEAEEPELVASVRREVNESNYRMIQDLKKRGRLVTEHVETDGGEYLSDHDPEAQLMDRHEEETNECQ